MHYMYVQIILPLTKAILIMFEHVTTHYQTLKPSIGHTAALYHKFNALPCALSYTLPYIFSQFNIDRP